MLSIASGLAISLAILALLKAADLSILSKNEQRIPTQRAETKTEQPDISYSELLNRGYTFTQKGLTALALKTYAEASQKEPQKPEPYLAIANIHLKNRDFERARKNFDVAHELLSTSLDAALGLVRTNLAIGEVEKAQKIADKLPEDAQRAAYYQGIIAAYLDNRDRAKEKFAKTQELSETQDLSEKAGQFLNAYREFEATEGGLEIYRKTLIGKAFNDVGEPTLAVPLLLGAVQERGDYRDAWLQLGYAYLQKNDFQNAKDALDKAYLLDPEKVETVYLLGIATFGLNDTNGAIRYLEIALKNDFQPKIHVQQKLAELYILQKRYGEATKLYETILQEDSSNLDYFSRPVWLYLEELQNTKAALDIAEQAYKNHPDEAQSFNLLGWALLKDGQIEKAKEMLEEALKRDPFLASAYLNLGTVYEQENFLNAAKAHYKRAYELSPEDGVSQKAAEKFNSLLENANDAAKNTLNQPSL